MGKKIDLSGHKYNALTAIQDIGSNGKRRLWLCKCDCGNTITCSTQDLRDNRKTSCGCGIGIHPNTKYTVRSDALIAERISKYKYSAKRRDIAWQLSFEQAKNLFLKICHYCGTEPAAKLHYRWFTHDSKSETQKRATQIHINVNGIDRVNNQLGYTVCNTVSCCIRCNKAKNNMTLKDFQRWIKKVYDNFYG